LYSPTLKRLFDLLVTLPALLVLAPFLLVIALLVRLKLGAPHNRQPYPGQSSS